MKRLVLGVLLLATTVHAAANEKREDHTGWIVGGGIGSVSLSLDIVNQASLRKTKQSTTLLTAFGGYNFTNWFGIEFDLSQSSDITDENTQLDAYAFGTSFTPKFIYHVNDGFSLYIKGGLQYISYRQDVDSSYRSRVTWTGLAPIYGAGMLLGFDSGLKFRLDYKYSDLTLKQLHYAYYWGIPYYVEKMNFTYSALTLTAHYQF